MSNRESRNAESRNKEPRNIPNVVLLLFWLWNPKNLKTIDTIQKFAYNFISLYSLPAMGLMVHNDVCHKLSLNEKAQFTMCPLYIIGIYPVSLCFPVAEN